MSVDATAHRCICRNRRRRGFTFVELSLSLLVTGMVGAAIAAFATAVADAWRYRESGQTVSLAGEQAVQRLSRLLRQSRMVTAYSPGSTSPTSTAAAEIMLWAIDNPVTDTNNDGVADSGDGKCQADEVVLVSHNRTTGRIELYTMSLTGMTKGQRNQVNELISDDDYEYIRTVANFADFKSACGGAPSGLLGGNVRAMSLAVSSPGTGKTLVEVQMRLDVPMQSIPANTTYATAVSSSTTRTRVQRVYTAALLQAPDVNPDPDP